jgi:TonB family protein
MKSSRPLTLIKLAALTTLTLLAFTALAQDSKPSQTQETKPEGGGPAETRPVQNLEGPLPVVKRAIITAKPEPDGSGLLDYDAPSRVVRLRAILSASGDVTNITVVKGLPGGLTERAVEAAKQIKFTPAQKDGRPVSQYVTLEYRFNVYYEEIEVTKKVVITEQPQPVNTEEALRNRVAGKVVVEALFRRDGKVESPEVVEGLPYGLSETAIGAARRIKFIPAEIKGRKVTVIRRVEYVFSPDANAPTAKP